MNNTLLLIDPVNDDYPEIMQVPTQIMGDIMLEEDPLIF